MKLVAISEHFFPRVGGTVNYVHQTLLALVRQGISVQLWVPGPAPERWLPDGMAAPPYEIVWIDVGYPAQGDPNRAARYGFARAVNDRAQALRVARDKPDLLHLMFGLFVMELLDTAALRSSGLPCVVTVHNVPPQECGLLALEAQFMARLKEVCRLWLVGWKNRARLRANPWDAIVVPSENVRELLLQILKKQQVDVIGHGPTGALLALMNPPATRCPEDGIPVRLLTVGGYAPHKRQHLIPEVAARLGSAGMRVEWDVVGPSGRIEGYYESVRAIVTAAGLSDRVHVRAAVPFVELAALYDAAHLYVQPSIEEGFCMTALDAAAAGLPVIASPAGALGSISRASGGTLADSSPGPLAEAIVDFVTNCRWGDAAAHAAAVKQEFSWDTAARALRTRYARLSSASI